MVTVKIYDNGTYIGNSPNSRVPELSFHLVNVIETLNFVIVIEH